MPGRFTVQAPDLQVIHHDEPPHVALVGLLPVYAHGLQSVLRGSTASCTVVSDLAQLPALLTDLHPLVIVVPIGGAAAVLPAGASPTAPSAARHAMVVLLDEAKPEACAQALQAGATGILTASDLPADVVTVVRCAGRGQTVLARDLVRALCRPAPLPPALTPAEKTWLRRLAAGGTVAGLARGCGYSEREMYRRLSTVYQHLGARTRTEALLLAERFGLLDNRS